MPPHNTSTPKDQTTDTTRRETQQGGWRHLVAPDQCDDAGELLEEMEGKPFFKHGGERDQSKLVRIVGRNMWRQAEKGALDWPKAISELFRPKRPDAFSPGDTPSTIALSWHDANHHYAFSTSP